MKFLRIEDGAVEISAHMNSALDSSSQIHWQVERVNRSSPRNASSPISTAVGELGFYTTEVSFSSWVVFTGFSSKEKRTYFSLGCITVAKTIP